MCTSLIYVSYLFLGSHAHQCTSASLGLWVCQKSCHFLRYQIHKMNIKDSFLLLPFLKAWSLMYFKTADLYIIAQSSFVISALHLLMQSSETKQGLSFLLKIYKVILIHNTMESVTVQCSIPMSRLFIFSFFFFIFCRLKEFMMLAFSQII